MQINFKAHTARTAFTLALALAAGAAQADFAVTADLGTTGIGAHIVVPMEKTLNGRFGANYFSRSYDKRASTIDYKLDGKLQTVDVLFDWYLIEGSPFHLTGGVMYNGNRITGNARPDSNSNYTINGKSYTSAAVGQLVSTLDYGNAAPYLGIGWGNALTASKRLSFTAELGAFFQGNPKATLVNIGCTGTAAACLALSRDVVAEGVKFEKDIDALRTYPVLRVALAYKF